MFDIVGAKAFPVVGGRLPHVTAFLPTFALNAITDHPHTFKGFHFHLTWIYSLSQRFSKNPCDVEQAPPPSVHQSLLLSCAYLPQWAPAMLWWHLTSTLGTDSLIRLRANLAQKDKIEDCTVHQIVAEQSKVSWLTDLNTLSPFLDTWSPSSLDVEHLCGEIKGIYVCFFVFSGVLEKNYEERPLLDVTARCGWKGLK